LFATRDSSTSGPQQESNSAVEHVSQAVLLDGDAAPETRIYRCHKHLPGCLST